MEKLQQMDVSPPNLQEIFLLLSKLFVVWG